MTSLRNFLLILRDGGARDSYGTLTSHGRVEFIWSLFQRLQPELLVTKLWRRDWQVNSLRCRGSDAANSAHAVLQLAAR